ncbi:hypothetical protein D1159_13645 [Pseudoflavonifractor sp. 524-17]|uniref:putative glycoside hydrolase n=1 Tax=Pseudoflavonifractor sp. 524-17 TaxID=2304577 RepID=UPI00137AAAC8|nr:putative glycoside hydrolase [Pseudoflavonifractor sp. 524-17]NCE65595.1 hypothetical protein [Pseudoflavonifractor sp. 524-17]
MSKRNHYGYAGYSGRPRGQGALKVIIVILALILAAALALFFFLEDHLVFSGDGVRLELPFGKEETEEVQESEPPPPSEPLVIVTPEPTPTPEPEKPLQAVWVDRADVLNGAAEEKAEAAGANAVIVDMKDDEGTLGYVSDLETAKTVKSSASEPERNNAIQALNNGPLYTVARVCCFRDNTAPRGDRSLAIKTNSGYNWQDGDKIRWISPTSPEARQYVTDVCVELAELGFDEILLDYSAYPTTGKLNYIKKGAAYNREEFQAIVEDFYAQVKGALADYPEVTLSILTDEGVLVNGVDETSGQSLTGLAGSAGRVWCPLENLSPEEGIQALAAAGLEEPERNFVPVVSQAGGPAESWAVMER